MTAYPLESTDRERKRLERQARVLGPFTERLMRAAGAELGGTILDLGTGAGDVALLAGKLVGPSGRVVSIDRDPDNLDRARGRAKAAGAKQITFMEGDIAQPPQENFDLSIGRYVLMYQPDPTATVRAIANAIRPGGCVAFHEINLYDGMRGDSWPLPSETIVRTMMKLNEAMRRRVQNHIGPLLPTIFADAGLDISDWGFEMASPLVRRDDAALLGPGLMRTFAPLAIADGLLKAEEINADEYEQWWLNTPEAAALALPAAVLGWARKPA